MSYRLDDRRGNCPRNTLDPMDAHKIACATSVSREMNKLD